MKDIKNTLVGTIIEKPLTQEESKETAGYAATYFIQSGIPFMIEAEGESMNVTYPAKYEGQLNAMLLAI